MSDLDNERQISLERMIKLTDREAEFVNKNPQNERARAFISCLNIAVTLWDEPSFGILKGSASEMRNEMIRLGYGSPLVGTTFGSLVVGDVFSLEGFEGYYEKVSYRCYQRFQDPKAKKQQALFATKVFYRKEVKG